MKRYIITLIAILVGLSCGGAQTVDPQVKSKIDTFYKNSGASFGASQKITGFINYAVGQFVIYGITDDDGNRSISRTSIVGREKGGWIFEFYNLNNKKEDVVQILMTGMEKAAKSGKPEDVDILWIKAKDEKGKVQKIEGSMLSMYKTMYKNNIAAVVNKSGKYETGGAVKVPAGNFAATYKIYTEMKFLGKTYKSNTWVHSVVPINKVVKSITDGTSTMELLKFGKNAVSQF